MLFKVSDTCSTPPQILTEAEKFPLADSSRALAFDLLCAMANPSRADTRGLSALSLLTERFAFALATGMDCGAPGQRSVAAHASAFVHPWSSITAHFVLRLLFLFVSNFLPFSPNLVANRTHISPIVPRY